jgi:DNA invertase Pin-like site-specific DNA recombinase
MKIGYTRVSIQDQELALQLDTPRQAGCEQTYQEKISGSTKERRQLQKLLEHLRARDVVVIWKLGR